MPRCPCGAAPGLCVQGIPEAAEAPPPTVRQGAPAAAAGTAEQEATGTLYARARGGARAGSWVPNVILFNLFGPEGCLEVSGPPGLC